ncbi:MAG: phenylalanine--tRNA ligase subunit beta, partial [Dehalococcoidales bacterium]|nr:phenylalanine--tRNA ligase subunit beta [Dehalococcoidales bacterium]
MKVPISWLKEYVDITLPLEELAHKLTLSSHEVAEIISTGGDWDNVVVGQITAIDPHPNADRLHLATVDLGGEQQQVVCGAPNLAVGDKIAFARVGARLMNPYSGKVEELKTAKIRGVESSGMVCSEKELGLSEAHEGILVLKPESVIGKPLASQLGDTVFDFEILTNRPDCLSVVGIAREVAALTGQALHIPEISYEETGDPIEGKVSIEIADAELCPRYCATLITGITIAESPAWLQERLTAAGQRPINNIVDISNYIMLEYGQPLHTFDYDRLVGQHIVARRAEAGELFTTLDEQDRQLTGNMCVIGDAARTVAIAGVMGGLNSEVTYNTANILVEAASFKPGSIHYTSHYLDLRSEASTRFERGISAEMTIPALRHATQLIAELGKGTVAKGIIDVYPGKKEPAAVTVTVEKAERVIGIPYTEEQIVDSLTALGFSCEVKGKKLHAVAPSWRSDIKYDVDLIEEVARVIGYDKIPLTLLGEPIPHQNPDPVLALRKNIRQCLTGYGLQEIMNYTLTSMD